MCPKSRTFPALSSRRDQVGRLVRHDVHPIHIRLNADTESEAAQRSISLLRALTRLSPLCRFRSVFLRGARPAVPLSIRQPSRSASGELRLSACGSICLHRSRRCKFVSRQKMIQRTTSFKIHSYNLLRISTFIYQVSALFDAATRPCDGDEGEDNQQRPLARSRADPPRPCLHRSFIARCLTARR